MSISDILGKAITGNGDDQRRNMLGNIVTDALNNQANVTTDRGRLPAPYNIIVAPVNAGDGRTAQGNDYEKSLEQYLARVAKVDQTEEAKQIRQAWSTPPRVSVEKGVLQLSGTKAFLQSDTAKQLRAVFKEMNGQTYNTESLNKQIEAWNSDLQKMADSYISSLDNYNKLNYNILQTAKNPQSGPITFNEYMMLMNSANVGRDSNAANSNKLIFVGYEWDDDGNKKPVYKTAAEFFNEFNSIPDSKKRDAYRDLTIQANEGDVSAMSKLFYLRGESEGSPANVTYSSAERWNDFLRTAWENTVVGLAEAADFATTYVPIINLPRLAGRVGQAINAQDASKFFESDFIRKGIDDFEDVVGWENEYYSQLTPGSTQLAAISGSVVGGVLGMAYSIWAGSVGNAALFNAVNGALTGASNYLLGTGKFVEYSASVSSATGKLQNVVMMNNGAVMGTGQTIAGMTQGAIRGSVILPTALVQKYPAFAEAIAKVGLQMQLATGLGGAGSIANIAGRSGDTIGVMQGVVQGPTLATPAVTNQILGAAELTKLRMQAGAIRMAANLYALGNESAIRHIDQYFQKENRGEEVGNMAEYVAGGVARDIILGGAMIAGGAAISHFANLSRASDIPATKIVEGGYTATNNSQSGFYTTPATPLLGTGGSTIDTDIANTFSTIATVNGEKFFFSPVEGMVPTVIPGTEGGGAFGAVSTLENTVNKTTIEPVVNGFTVVTEMTNLNTGNKITTTKFFSDLDAANDYAATKSVPTVNPSTLMNSDLAATGNIVPFSVGGRSALKLLPNGVSHARIQADISYLTPAEYAKEVTPIVEMMSPELRAAYEKAMATEDINGLSQQIYSKDAPAMDAPRLFVPRTEAEAIELARSVAKAQAVATTNPNSSPIMPVRTEPDDIEIVKRRRMVTERKFVSGPAPQQYDDFDFTGKPTRARLAPAEYYAPFEEKYISQEEGEEINNRIPAEWQRKWFVEGARSYRDKIAELILSDPELRNACLVKMYDEWVEMNKDMGFTADISYEEWLDTDITLYRWSGGKNSKNGGARGNVLSYSFFPGGYPQFGRESDSITITPRETTGMGDWFNGEGSEQEVFVPVEVVVGKEKLDTELKNRQKAAIAKSGHKAPKLSDIKTYSEVMTNDILNHGMSDSFTRGDVYRALSTNQITVYGAQPIEDGVKVYADKKDALDAAKGGKVYEQKANLSDVAWKDASNGIFASDTIYPTLFDWANANKLYGSEPEFSYGAKIKRVRMDGQDVELDYEIADRIAELNKNGFETFNSHSGIAADHEEESHAGGGYIQFNGSIDGAKKDAIKKAAQKADMVVDERFNPYYGQTISVYQTKFKDGQSRFDIIRQANLNTVKHYKLPRKSLSVSSYAETEKDKNWLTLLEEQGKMREGLDYRNSEEKKLIEEAGGDLLDTDAKRKESWDKFFSELGIEKTPNEVSIEEIKRRKTIEVEQRTPRNIVVTEYGLPKKWFSNIEDAMAYKKESAARSIYKIDDSATTLDRPPVTMDNIYLPGVRGDMGVAAAMNPVDFKYTPNTSDAVERFNGLMTAMPTLIDSPTDYTQGIVDIAAQVKAVHDEIAKAVDLGTIYEDYARQIAEGVEQPTVPDNAKETLKPLTDMLTSLGKYFDPSGKSLTQEFYLPTGAPSKKLATIEDALLHPEKAVDPDNVLDGSFDDILIDPLRVGDSGFWEKRTGELFRNEDGEFTMAKAGTLEENLMAYTVSALTRGQNRLLVTANDEVALSKADRNRNTITTEQALKGLKSADKNRARIRAAQLKAAHSYDKAMKKEKMGKLVEDYSDKAAIDAIEEAYASRNFVKELDYTHRTNKDAKALGYRQTLTINPLKGSALRFGTEGGIKGIANDIRAASHITVTGTKWVRRYGEYVNVGFGMTDEQQSDYEFTRIEPAVNLGDSANMMFSPDRAAAKLFENIQSELAEYTTSGGWGLNNILNDFARQNFPLITNPEKSVNRLVKQIATDFEAYNGTEAFNVAVLSRLSTWVKNSAANNINSAIQMADITHLDDRTIRAIDQIMTKANVGVAVYQGKIVSALQQLAYQATLAFNFSPMVGNILSEPARALDFYKYKVFARAMKKLVNPKELARVKKIVGDLPSRFADDRELVGLAERAKTAVGRAAEVYTNVSMSPLQKSEEFKNLLFWLCAEENAKLMYPNDPSAQLQNTLRTFNDTAIAGGQGTTPGVANSDLGRAVFILKTFSLRNWDDFIEMVEQIGYGRSGSYYWDRTNRGQDTGGQGGYSSTAGKKKFDWKKAGRFMGGTLLRRYLLWLLVLGPLGRSIWDALGGDPTGLTENFSRGLYDDEGTDAYEGMTPIDNIINAIPTGFIFGTLKDLYFAARRSGVETGNFFGGIDITKDPRLQKDLRQHLPVGTVTNRIGDMLELLDRGYSYNSYGNKTYAAPENIGDVIKGFMLGKSTTSNAQAYNKYRYGSVNIWGDLFSGDWMDFAMSANPFADNLGLVKFDTTREDYNGVFHGSYNDVPTIQAAIADLRNRRSNIIKEYGEDLEKYTGAFQGLNDSQKKELAEERRDKKIKDFTDDVQRLVDEYQKVGNALSDTQITTLMYLFDFNEGDDDTYDSQIARERYVEAGLPDYNPINQTATKDKETGDTNEQNYFQRSLVYQNAVQGRYGVPRNAAKEIDKALSGFKSTYKAYKEKVKGLNDKAYAAAKGSATRKKYQAEVEKVQEQYLNQLYSALTPVIQKYGTEVLSSNDVVESLQPYMSSMIPYSSIRKYGLTFSSGNDIVWGQLSDWIKNRWGATAPTVGSDPEITQGIKEIKTLKNSGKTGSAKSKARLLLDKIARGTVSARNNDVIELRRLLYE